jgi:hypothetical protein
MRGSILFKVFNLIWKLVNNCTSSDHHRTVVCKTARHDKLLFGESSQKLCLKLQPLAILINYAVPSRSLVL